MTNTTDTLEDLSSDLTIILDGETVEELKNAHPSDDKVQTALAAAMLAAMCGRKIEMQVSNPVAYEQLSRGASFLGIKVTLAVE